MLKASIKAAYLISKLDKNHVLIGCGVSDDLDTFNKFSTEIAAC